MRVGVLIIGSLLWDNDPIRIGWRESRLSLDDRQQIRAPIGYRKRSETWHCAFTMTFRPDAALGKAILVPCRNQAGDANAVLQEAQELWQSEHRSQTVGPIAATWGCVGAAFRSAVSPDVTEWSHRFRRKVASPVAPVDGQGILAIPWPTRTEDDKPADCDVILATATKPSPTIPDARVVAEAWLEQSGGAEKYFFENIRCGIRTPEDIDIWEHIASSSPTWLTDVCYAEAIATLQKEVALASNKRVEPPALNLCGQVRAFFRRGSRADR